ncbi:MAG: orange carotenoid protein N-terminal domain-containing protein [Microcoleaceae cyanobacterium]
MSSATSASKDNLEQSLNTFRELEIDNQLAFLWFVYTKMGDSVTPAAPGAAGIEIANGLYDQVKALSHDEQLQVQRDLLAQKQDEEFTIAREYAALTDKTKLLFWYRLAEGMEQKEIIPMPNKYELPENGQNLLATIESMEFQEQLTFLRKVVVPTKS